MRRVIIAAALLFPLSLPAFAQPWATDEARRAGRAALAAAAAGRWAEAEAIATRADPLVPKLILWLRLSHRTAPASAAELIAFIAANPEWPHQETLLRRAEAALIDEVEDLLILSHFRRHPPQSLAGAARFAEALLRRGEEREALALTRRAWAEGGGEAGSEELFLARFGPWLREEDHWRRFDRLSFARDFAAAARLLPYLGGEFAAAARTRLALAREDESALSQPARDLGTLYEQARLLRRRDRDSEAAALWAAAEGFAPEHDGDIARILWAERHILARKLLRLGHAAEAYRVAASHGLTTASEARQEAEFLAGFIALRRLHRPAAAERHFAALALGSRSAITRARSAYWQGRAFAAAGDTVAAQRAFQSAAAWPTTFYGQLAALALGEDTGELTRRLTRLAPAAIDPSRQSSFATNELARAALTLADLGQAKLARPFLLRLEERAADSSDRRLTARLAQDIGRPDYVVWIARRASASGDILFPEGWPVPYRLPVPTPEPALIYAIARQESNFDPEAISRADARGLMQLLPATALEVGRELGLHFAPAELTRNPHLNLRLGTAYIERMLTRYGGALPLAIAAYNAGPRRVDEWLLAYGDPRTGSVDILDWLEQIPFAETRNYVQRVIENIVIYRHRLNEGIGRPHPLAPWLEPKR